MVLALGAVEALYDKFKDRKDKKKKKAYEAGMAAGMEKAGGGAGMSVNRKKGGKIKAKKKGSAPHNRLY
jgi:hypothetical protein